MAENPTTSFGNALQQLETDGDVDTFVSTLFAEDPVLVRGETAQEQDGAQGAEAFWQQYLDQFSDIRSEFDRVVHGEVGVLEWTSRGHLASGADIEYRGVSLLEFDDDRRVTRFATYYDTAAFTV